MPVTLPLWAAIVCTGCALGLLGLSIVSARLAFVAARSIDTDRFRSEVRKERAHLSEVFEAECAEVRALGEAVRRDASSAADERELAKRDYSRARAAESRAERAAASDPAPEETNGQEVERRQESPADVVARIAGAQRAAGLMVGE